MQPNSEFSHFSTIKAEELRPDSPLWELLDWVAVPVLVLEISGRIVHQNRSAQGLTGYTLDEIKDKMLWDCFFEKRVQSYVQEYFADPDRILRERHMTNRWRMKTGEIRRVSWNTTVLQDESGQPALIVGTARDVTNEYLTHNALRASEENYKRLVANMNEGMGVADADNVLTYVNQSLAEMIGYDVLDIIGRNLDDFLTPDGVAIHQAEYARRKRGESGLYELSWQHSSGREVWARVSAEPLLDDEGQFIGSFGIVTDITASRAAAKEREILIEQLESFASTVAHDLKNPLNTVLNYAEVVASVFKELPENELREYLGRITNHAKKMHAVIDELLVLASVDASEVAHLPLDMHYILNEVMFRIEHFLYDFPDYEIIVPEKWPQSYGHPPWVEQVWINYLTNALKYGGNPPIVTVGAEEEADGFVRFWVKDNGAGIEAGQREQLFRPWRRLDQHIRAKGHGLGLSIVRRIVERLGGQVGCESVPGQGSRFWFTLPSTPPHPAKDTE